MNMRADDRKGERSGRAYIIRAEVNAGRGRTVLKYIDMYVCKYICMCTHCVCMSPCINMSED